MARGVIDSKVLILIGQIVLIIVIIFNQFLTPNTDWLYVGALILSIITLKFYQLIIVACLLPLILFTVNYEILLASETYLFFGYYFKWKALKKHNLNLKPTMGSGFLSKLARGDEYSSYDFYYTILSIIFLIWFLKQN